MALFAIPTPSLTTFQNKQTAKMSGHPRLLHMARAATTRSQLSDGQSSSYPSLPMAFDHMVSFIRNDLSQSIGAMNTVVQETKNEVVQIAVETLFKDSDTTNMQFEGNFGPVNEIGPRVKVEVIDGSIPKDFPIGVYVRNGPNPQFGGKIKTSSIFGDLQYHWFEGDGMLHATYFGQHGKVFYQNKYVETQTYKEEKKHERQFWLSTIHGDSKAIQISYLLNFLRFGKVNRVTCNTSIIKHANRLFANAEASFPLEIDPTTLSTIGEWNICKEWGVPFTSHPKRVRDTNEMVIFGFSAVKPYYKSGLISADGKHIVHMCDSKLDKPMFSHEISITKSFDIIMYMPLTIDIQRLQAGGNLLDFDDHAQAKFGIKPRYGEASSIRWFPVKSHYTFHVVNSYEDGDEVVLHACRANRPLLMPPPPGMDAIEWFARGMNANPIDHVVEPHIDGALFSTIHEWRFNLQTGGVLERDLTSYPLSMEMPRINDNYVGYKNKYTYAEVVDHEASIQIGMPKYGQLVKLTFEGKDNESTLEFHSAGQDVFYSEPLYVPRPNGSLEDDGWIITYVHNELTNSAEVHIIDAQRFSNPPITKIKLPQRVPYGFHSTFMNGLF